MSPLPQDAEDYLARLNRALWSLTDVERRCTVQEIRGHFEDRWCRGRLHLLSALDNMGPPEEIARAFVEATGRHWHGKAANENGATLPSTLVSSTALVVYVPQRRKLPWREVYGRFMATLAASRNGLWSVIGILIVALTAINFGFTANLLSGGRQGMPLALATTVRLVVFAIAFMAAYRALLTHDDLIWLPSRSMLQFAGVNLMALSVGSLIAVGAKTCIDQWLALGLIASIASGIATTVIVTVGAGAFLRLHPWLVGLAIEDERLSLLKSVEATASQGRSLLTAWLMLVVPLAMAHALVSALMGSMAFDVFIRIGLGLCVVDAALVALTVVAVAGLGAMSFREAVDEEVPEPAPFSTKAADWEESARVRRVMEDWIGYRRMALLAQEHSSG